MSFADRPVDPTIDATIAAAGPTAVRVLLDRVADDSTFGELLGDGLVAEFIRHLARVVGREGVMSRDAFLAATDAAGGIAKARLRTLLIESIDNGRSRYVRKFETVPISISPSWT